MKGKRVAPGVLCLIVKAKKHPKNTGKVVTAIREVRDREY